MKTASELFKELKSNDESFRCWEKKCVEVKEKCVEVKEKCVEVKEKRVEVTRKCVEMGICPEKLKERVEKTGKRIASKEMESIIVDLCAIIWQSS